MGLAERADMIVDFTDVPVGNYVLRNVGPDAPFGGGDPDGTSFLADPATTGQIMQFKVVPAVAADPTTPPQFLRLPAIAPLPPRLSTRPLALLEMMSMAVRIRPERRPCCGHARGRRWCGMPMHKMWVDAVTENPAAGDTEVWEFYNFTVDAHPMHVHEVVFEVVNRQELVVDGEGAAVQPSQFDGNARPREPWESGFKDTVIAYPGEVTRIRAQFKKNGQFVWHCHIVEHEDNEMMRPFRIGPLQPGQPDADAGAVTARTRRARRRRRPQGRRRLFVRRAVRRLTAGPGQGVSALPCIRTLPDALSSSQRAGSADSCARARASAGRVALVRPRPLGSPAAAGAHAIPARRLRPRGGPCPTTS